MRVTRIFVDQPLAAGTEILLPADAAHHVARVLRMKRGQSLILFNGHGGEHAGVLETIRDHDVMVRIEEYRALERESTLPITLVQVISRGKRMDYTLQKSVELGVSRIVPVVSEHGQVRLDVENADNKLAHWRKVIIAACEQCGRNRLPELVLPGSLTELLDSDQGPGLRLLLDPASGQGLRDLSAPDPGMGITLMAGPEGGFSDSERAAARTAGYLAIGLGPRVLRTETAAPAAITACQALWGDLA